MNKKFHLLKLVACIMSSICIMQSNNLWSMESESKPISEIYSQALNDTKSEKVLSLENLIVNGKALKLLYDSNNYDEMKQLATTRRAIRKAVINLRDSITEAKKTGQYQNLDSDPKQIETKLETKQALFTKALQDFCANRNQNTILRRISMVFKQLSLILNNETKNIENIDKQLEDDYQLNYLFNNILLQKESKYKFDGEDMSSDVLNWFIGYWLEFTQSITECLNTLSKLTYVTSDGSTLHFDKCIDNIEMVTFRYLVEKGFKIKANDSDRINELNKAISDAINKVKDKHLLETLDVLMSLIIKASKNIKLKVELSENEEENEKENEPIEEIEEIEVEEGVEEEVEEEQEESSEKNSKE